jgi:hypothetical protein
MATSLNTVPSVHLTLLLRNVVGIQEGPHSDNYTQCCDILRHSFGFQDAYLKILGMKVVLTN